MIPLVDVSKRANELFQEHLRKLTISTDRLFGYLMICQFIGAVVWAQITSPRTWAGSISSVHPHVLSAFFLGSVIAAPVCLLVWLRPGAPITRYTISVCQLLMSALLIHVSGGRIETHFHVFGSLAFLAFYRDWKLLIPATLVVLADHVVRGLYFPSSVYGVAGGAEWRFVEHAAWVVFEDVILIAACVRGIQELKLIADRQAQIEYTKSEVEALVEKRTEQLRHLERRKGAILSHALDGIVTIDREGKIIEFNPAAEHIFSFTRSQALGTPFTNLLMSRELDAFFFESDLSERETLSERVETEAFRDGKSFPIELAINAFRFEDDVMYTAFVRDLTEQKKLESELVHAQKMESVGQLATGIAHEINTPNQYIGDNIAFLQDGFQAVSKSMDSFMRLHQELKHSGELAPLVQQIEAEIQQNDLDFVLQEIPSAVQQAGEGVARVASIVNAMKEFSHPGLESITNVDVNQMLRSTVTVARHEWKYFAEVQLDLEPDLPVIEGHPGELGQVFLNLLVNSVHAVKEKFGTELAGRIVFRTRTAEEGIEISITDNGAGIPAHAKARVFEPFFTTKAPGRGTGQGLAISHTVITRRHFGSIKFETNEGVGTTFTITLPKTQAPEGVAA